MNSYLNLPICNPALERGCGKKSELNMTQEQVRSLELQGFIKNGISGDQQTWALTQHGRDVRNYFLAKPSGWTRVCDWVLRNIFRMDIVV